jgi:PAS domain S-box-containing protein
VTRRRILVVDDNSANRKLAVCALEGAGCEVIAVDCGEDALASIRDARPDVVLMDVQLPGLDGLEVTRRIRADPEFANVRIIAVTAYAMKGDRELALAAGCDGYITKPIDPITLPDDIASLVGWRSAPSTAEEEPSARASGGRRRVLVVEDNPATCRLYRAALEDAGYEVRDVDSGADALAEVRRATPDAIVQDLVLPDIEGRELALQLRRLLGERAVPIVCVSGFLAHLDDGETAGAGFSAVLVKPIDPFQLVETLAACLDPSPPEPSGGSGSRVLVVDDDPVQRRLVSAWLVGAGHRVSTASDGDEGLVAALRERPDVIVSDVLMPRVDGYSFCLSVRNDARVEATPIVLISSAHHDPVDAAMATNAGASAYLSRGEGMEVLLETIEAVRLVPPPRPAPDAHALIGRPAEPRSSWQLERQVRQNARLIQRLAHLESQLAVLAGIAEALTESRLVDSALGGVLAACLDMAGISKGALYALEEGGRLALVHQIGFPKIVHERLAQSLGRREELIGVAARGRVQLLPSMDAPDDWSEELTRSCGVRSLLLVPVQWSGRACGLLLLGGRTADVERPDARAFARVLAGQIGQAISLARAFTRIGASERRYRTLTENTNDALLVLDRAGVLIDVNRSFAAVIGARPEELVGRRAEEFVAQSHVEVLRTLLATPMEAPKSAPIQLEVVRRSGGTALFEFSIAAVTLADEEAIFTIGRDVTEQVKAQAQLMVSDRMASLGMLAAGVAHEINNPLAAVLAHLDLAATDGAALSVEPAQAPRLEDMRSSIVEARDAAERMRIIVKDLRIFSRAGEDERVPVDLRRVLDSTLRMAWNEIRQRARVQKNYGPVPIVEANEARLGQVFLNLVINAAQAIPVGRPRENEIVVTTSTDAEGRAVVEVRDTGEGIRPEDCERLFTPFFTTKPSGVGTGLGLTICRRLVTSFGGTISVASKLGVGTTFRVVFPASPAPERSPSPPAENRRRRGRVLVVDDDNAVGATLVRVLEAEHDVEFTASAVEALASIRSGARYDVILCDLSMPSVSGARFHDELSKWCPEQVPCIAFLTGAVFSEWARVFLERVPNARFEKPFDVQVLRDFVRERVR